MANWTNARNSRARRSSAAPEAAGAGCLSSEPVEFHNLESWKCRCVRCTFLTLASISRARGSKLRISRLDKRPSDKRSRISSSGSGRTAPSPPTARDPRRPGTGESDRVSPRAPRLAERRRLRARGGVVGRSSEPSDSDSAGGCPLDCPPAAGCCGWVSRGGCFGTAGRFAGGGRGTMDPSPGDDCLSTAGSFRFGIAFDGTVASAFCCGGSGGGGGLGLFGAPASNASCCGGSGSSSASAPGSVPGDAAPPPQSPSP